MRAPTPKIARKARCWNGAAAAGRPNCVTTLTATQMATGTAAISRGGASSIHPEPTRVAAMNTRVSQVKKIPLAGASRSC